MAGLRRNPLKRAVYFGTKRLYALTGKIPSKHRTPHSVDGRPVVVIHNPKAAGSTLKAMLGAAGTTHTMPHLAYNRHMWRGTFSVVAVRHPFDRFTSGFTFFVRAGKGRALHREKAGVIPGLDPFQFLEFIGQYPEKLGPQTNWTHHRDVEKPTADLILKAEDSARWPEILAAAGLPCEAVPHRNPSRASGETYADIFQLPAVELARLEAAVYNAYAGDYAAYGYNRMPVGW